MKENKLSRRKTMAIIVKDAYFNSSTGMDRIHCMIWENDEVEKIGVIQLAHGVSEYIERYDDFARFLADNGYIVCGNDHLGHGLSARSMEELGFFCEVDGDVRMVDDMHILHNIMHKRYPDLPYYLFGHSMGSFCARVYAADFGEELAGLILCGTGELPSASILAEEPLRKLSEKLDSAFRLDTSAIMKYFLKEGQTGNDWLSYNKENIAKYEADPYCGVPLTVSGGRDLVSLANSACNPQWASRVPVGLPILLISGAKDPIGFNGRGVINVCDNLEDAGHKPEVILYPGMKHEILNEDEHERVYRDVLEWLKKN
ncbi:MAG: alpha/beta hydrolase [Ruminococcaceae bacterium]|nr:alpha/beta hydrolase [Oscillospiraceae bacterium]